MAGKQTDYVKIINDWVREILNQGRTPTEIVMSRHINDYMIRQGLTANRPVGEIRGERIRTIGTVAGLLPVRIGDAGIPSIDVGVRYA